ncbi:MAG: glycoside hydrolase family 57 protein [Candidatus Aenigmarchaeota archaeon]|nr:glycoside hydrolase family 57 protein [Candidatus Aenigmarchaeota archaeon]
MASVCLYFQVHQPIRLNRFSFFDIGGEKEYFDSEKNRYYLERVARKCYRPANQLLLDMIKQTGGQLKLSFSITGILLEELEKNFPDVLDSFRKLADTGSVELMSETYYHSLAFLISKKEFMEQVKMHREKIRDVFGLTPTTFRNTEAMYSNEVADTVKKMGYKCIIAEGLDHILGWRSPNYLYKSKGAGLPVLLRNFRLSDDISFRFSTREWEGWPLTADKFSAWLKDAPGEIINLFMDYETFGEHQWEETGIFNFLKFLPGEILKHENLNFMTPAEIARKLEPKDVYDVPYLSSWADVHRDLSAWLENDMQKKSFSEIKRIGNRVKRKGDKRIIDMWRKLQTSDHYYYMCTKWFADGDVHKYFNYYDNPYEAFLNFMNIMYDLKKKVS